MDFSLGFSRKFIGMTWSHWLIQSNSRLYGSGRAAFVDILCSLKKSGVSTIWIPTWQCHDLIEAIRHIPDLQIKFYHLSLDLLPTNIELKDIDPKSNAILVVDYFSSCNSEQLEYWVNHFSGYLLYDCVHSWLLSDIVSQFNRHNIVIVSGFRKLFFRFYGALVTGEITKSLPKFPGILRHASHQFPRSISLTLRFGVFSKFALHIINLKKLDFIAQSWASRGKSSRGRWSELTSPAHLEPLSAHQAKQSTPLNRHWHWPDLYGKLSPLDRQSAEALKSYFIVCKENHE